MTRDKRAALYTKYRQMINTIDGMDTVRLIAGMRMGWDHRGPRRPGPSNRCSDPWELSVRVASLSVDILPPKSRNGTRCEYWPNVS